MPPAEVSSLTLNRLSLYLRCLRELRAEGVDTVSSLELASRFHLSAAQIRKDLAHFGEFGTRGVGYDVDQLTKRLSGHLGLDRTHSILIVGAGNLGSALARFLSFDDRSFRVVAAIDHDPDKIGQSIGEVRIYSPKDLSKVVAETKAEIAVLAVPPDSAQEIYDRLIGAGIKAVLSFAPTRLAPKNGVATKAVDLRIFLEELGYQLQRAAVRTEN
ncbi:MAG: redox-sensing transcriptional repressor Rex [bacterium]|nr:redox-sensing transcriptional repressor Rex [bacterium]